MGEKEKQVFLSIIDEVDADLTRRHPEKAGEGLDVHENM